LDGVKKWCGNEVLVLVSLGLDTLSGDPIGGFDGFANVEEYIGIGKEIGDFSNAINAKTCFLLEGGYVVSKLGVCVENVFRGFINATTNPN
jgi:acetoin utilization deacetylase AcuC-like enzyme